MQNPRSLTLQDASHMGRCPPHLIFQVDFGWLLSGEVDDVLEGLSLTTRRRNIDWIDFGWF